MNFPGIRSYFEERIQLVDPNLEPWTEDVFGNNGIQTSIGTCFYNLFFGTLTNERLGNAIDNTVPVFVDIWQVDSRRDDVIPDYDALYQKAFDIYSCVINLQSIKDNPYTNFTTIQLTSITPLEELDSDNTFKMRLEFSITKTFCF